MIMKRLYLRTENYYLYYNLVTDSESSTRARRDAGVRAGYFLGIHLQGSHIQVERGKPYLLTSEHRDGQKYERLYRRSTGYTQEARGRAKVKGQFIKSRPYPVQTRILDPRSNRHYEPRPRFLILGALGRSKVIFNPDPTAF